MDCTGISRMIRRCRPGDVGDQRVGNHGRAGITGMRTLLWVSALTLLGALTTGCGTNPVTDETELQFISTTQEIRMGEQAYLPTRQLQGGDYVVDRKLIRYVQKVNARVAAASDRDLPYEIVVLNSSVPNAWAMPGGKMAINRGLLTQLNSEAELAAVLGHEIVHAAARHGARNQERGMLIQGGLLAAQVAAAGSEYGSLIAGGAILGAQLVSTRYSREAELEADLYGMEYMRRSGYNPAAAVDLQQTFVRLSEGRQSSWLEGLLASHPPSQERVARNRETAARLGGEQLEYGLDRYRKALAPLRRDQPAYDAHDQALQAAREKQFDRARSLVDQAIKLQPAEPKFYGLRGDLALNQKNYQAALKQYARAIRLNPDYFAFHLHQGYARMELGDSSGAIQSLERSNALLPTPNAQKVLGDLALAGGDRDGAIAYYSAAAASESDVGRAARVSLARLELAERPSKYLRTKSGYNEAGRVVIAVYNLAPLPVNKVEVSAAYFDAQGNQVSKIQRFRVKGQLPVGGEARIVTGATERQGLRTIVSKATIAG